MQRLHGIALGSLTALLLSSAIPTANAAPEVPVPPSSCPTGGTPLNVKAGDHLPGVTQAYFKDDPRLGPKDLPSGGLIGPLLDHYQRFMAMGPKNLIDCYWVVNQGSPPVTGWRFPPHHGFVTEPEQTTIVPVHKKLQLFGNNVGGEFLAPAGTLYRESAIPPSNLDTFQNPFPFNYHLFLVCNKTVPGQKSAGVPAEEGQIAPWFQQPGGGTQDWVGANASDFNTVGKLTTGGFLQDITDTPTLDKCKNDPPS